MPDMIQKARSRRVNALARLRRTRVNMFDSGDMAPGTQYSVIAHFTDIRVRMGRRRLALTIQPG